MTMPKHVAVDNLKEAKRIYGENLTRIDQVTNMNTGFKGWRFLNRPNAVNITKLDKWINEMMQTKKGVMQNRPLAAFTLPGAHDAMTYAYRGSVFSRNIATFIYGGTKTQTLTLVAQFKMGIRFFDIRVHADKEGHLYGEHGGIKFTHVDARQEIRRLFILAKCKNEPIVIKFKHNKEAYPILKQIASDFSPHIMNTRDYWHKPVSQCIKKGKVICLFHKKKSRNWKHKVGLKSFKQYEDEKSWFGSYSKHKMGGFSNTHFLKKHAKYVNKNIDSSPTLKEERLKVISLNIPCVSTNAGRLALDTATGLGVLSARVAMPLDDPSRWIKWVGLYKSVKDIENEPDVKRINKALVKKMTALVDSWYTALYDINYGHRNAMALADKVTGMVSGVVGMDFVGDKRQLVLELIELNNRDF
ncbi:hypothetical protein ACODM8_15655 [Vibrio ostreicida]|uniref:Phosphatidylinositol diacylglycerol-lyase n=1 Tax=Vibrio ostreicida TaxID=526588 RepID=A0ABT8BZK2_9VIBR|nr:hypothetical protein [Vibrio ostreicida]MDN3612129.1 hypothetical protein [Vibrio ostreicida]NPD08529.1 hypothetical protein [Vibrio ostreicida]